MKSLSAWVTCAKVDEKEISKQYPASVLWKYIPKLWRHWWIESFVENAISDTVINIDYPEPFFVDRTNDIREWHVMIDTMSLPKIGEACNKFLLPNVLCPYGCSSFIHRHGIVSSDLMFQRYLPRIIISKMFSNRKGFKYLLSTRDDFLRKDNDYDKWLLNDDPMWSIRPTITFIEGVSFVMTCDDHSKGTKSLFIHPPRSTNNNTLSSKYSDQLAHCTLRTRSIKPIQKRYYATSYQMHEQRGSFNGIDTCNISTVRKFDFQSKLLSECEARSIVNRPDINSLLNELIREKCISKYTADEKRKAASNMYSDFDFEKYYNGGTYVPFECVMSMQKDISSDAKVRITWNRG